MPHFTPAQLMAEARKVQADPVVLKAWIDVDVTPVCVFSVPFAPVLDFQTFLSLLPW